MFEEISAVLLFICLVFFAILSSLVLNYGPRLMLRRLLKVWVTEERNEIENAVFMEHKKLETQLQLEGQAKQEDEKMKQEELREVEQRIMSLNEKLKQLSKEKIDLNDNYLHLTLTALSLLTPLISLLN